MILSSSFANNTGKAYSQSCIQKKRKIHIIFLFIYTEDDIDIFDMILRIIKIKKYIWLKKPDFHKNNRLLSLREKT